MGWLLLLMVADLRAEAHEAFANHVVAQNADRIRVLEILVKGEKSVTERRAMRKTIRDAKSGKEILTPGQETYRNLVSSDTRRTNAPDPNYAHSVRWGEAKAGDLLYLDFSYTSESGGGKVSTGRKNMKIVETADGYVVAHPIDWEFGRKLGEMVPTVNTGLTIKIVDGNEFKPRSGEILVDGAWYVGEVEPGKITLALIDPFEIKRIAQEKIAAQAAADNVKDN